MKNLFILFFVSVCPRANYKVIRVALVLIVILFAEIFLLLCCNGSNTANFILHCSERWPLDDTDCETLRSFSPNGDIVEGELESSANLEDNLEQQEGLADLVFVCLVFVPLVVAAVSLNFFPSYII